MKKRLQKSSARNTLLFATIFLLATTSTQLEAQGSLVFNGGFDPDASGWLTSNLGISAGFRSEKGNPGGFFLLDATPSISTDPTITQVLIGLEVGGVYLISGSYQYSIDRGGSINGDSFGVALDGANLFTAPTPSLLERSKWQNFSAMYTATSTSATLSLSAQLNGTGVSYGIDNIAMTAVPEPSAFAFLICFCMAWMFSARSKLKR